MPRKADRDETEAQRLDRNWSSLQKRSTALGWGLDRGGCALVALAAFWCTMPLVGGQDGDDRY